MLQLVDREDFEDGAFVLLPRYEVKAAAGRGIIPTEERIGDFVAFEAAYLKAAGISPLHAHLIQVEGRSMVPTLVDGEWVIVDTSATHILNNHIYAVVYQEGVLVKRVRREGEAVILISDNKGEVYPDERIEGDALTQFKVVGRVKRHIRSL